MGRKFNIPEYYRSSVVSTIKNARRVGDSRKKDLSPSILDFGPVRFSVARHFGFCFGVENAIEIAYRAVAENPEKRVFLLSEMIHNPHVNSDLISRGVQFILAPDGKQLIPFEELTPEDIVIVPAFGTTVELFKTLEDLGINPTAYDATCPFVEKVWKRSTELGTRGYTVIIHGKHSHEETRATFSHARLAAPSMVIRDVEEAKLLARYIRKELPLTDFFIKFSGRLSEGFDPSLHLKRIGVVNQTTMLASETQAISDLLKDAALSAPEHEEDCFADTRDTLCYATTENQEATKGLIEAEGDIAIVVGGYNSSNTSHLVELLEQHVPTYYIKDAGEIIDDKTIRHFALQHVVGIGDHRSGEKEGAVREIMTNGKVVTSDNWLPKDKMPLRISITAGASCPDVLVDEVIAKTVSFFPDARETQHALAPYLQQLSNC